MAHPKQRVLLRNWLCPGDIVMLTAAVRDLVQAHGDRYEIDVETSCGALWENNPFLASFDHRGDEVITLDCQYPLIHRSNDAPYHFIHGFAQFLEEKLGVRIPLTAFHGDIHLSDEEKGWMSQVQESGEKRPFWIVMAGGKYDFTAKWWTPTAFQKVVDHFAGRILFVQCGEEGHHHPPLRGVINLVGKTDLRQFIRLVYHSTGVLCPVTFAMHAAAAVPTAPGRPQNRPCVVIAGAREPAHWEAYPHHRYLSNNGALSCSPHGGCWKSRCQRVGDGDEKDLHGLCIQPVEVEVGLCVPKCMSLITPADVIRAIESYYDGGVLTYDDSASPTAEVTPIHRTEEEYV